MKQQLEQLNNYLLNLQYQQARMYGSTNDWTHMYCDKIYVSDYQGLLDITWFSGGDYTTTLNISDLPKYITDNTIQHCECSGKNEQDCECEYSGQGLSWFVDLLVAGSEKVRSLVFTGTDSGANGLRGWDFKRLLANNAVFTNLSELKVQLYQAGDHNINMIGEFQEDHRQVTQLLAKMPNIVSIELPTTPDKYFFSLPFPKLNFVKIQSGYNSNYFIKHLANSPLLSKMTLDFTDVWFDDELSYINSDANDGSLQDVQTPEGYQKRTSLDDYKALFTSPHMMRTPWRFHFILRESYLTIDQLFALQNINREIQLLHVPTSRDYYISHRMQDQNLW